MSDRGSHVHMGTLGLVASDTRGRLVAGLLLIAAAIGACGNDAGNGGGITAVRAGAATTATGSFRVSMESRIFDPESPKRTLGRSPFCQHDLRHQR